MAEIKTVQAVFSRHCQEEEQEVCAPAPGYSAGYGAPHDQCHVARRTVCYKEPSLLPVVKHVEIQLPVPREKCVNYPVLLPRVKCIQASSDG